jgi:hypothetical protein
MAAPPYVNWPAGKQAGAERYGLKKPLCWEVDTWQSGLPGNLFGNQLGEVIASTRFRLWVFRQGAEVRGESQQAQSVAPDCPVQ